MTALEKAICLLTKEVRGLRADLKLTTQKELLLAERKEMDDAVKRLASTFNNNQQMEVVAYEKEKKLSCLQKRTNRNKN